MTGQYPDLDRIEAGGLNVDDIHLLVLEVREARDRLADVRTVHSGAPVSLVDYHEALRRLREAAAGGAL